MKATKNKQQSLISMKVENVKLYYSNSICPKTQNYERQKCLLMQQLICCNEKVDHNDFLKQVGINEQPTGKRKDVKTHSKLISGLHSFMKNHQQKFDGLKEQQYIFMIQFLRKQATHDSSKISSLTQFTYWNPFKKDCEQGPKNYVILDNFMKYQEKECNLKSISNVEVMPKLSDFYDKKISLNNRCNAKDMNNQQSTLTSSNFNKRLTPSKKIRKTQKNESQEMIKLNTQVSQPSPKFQICKKQLNIDSIYNQSQKYSRPDSLINIQNKLEEKRINDNAKEDSLLNITNNEELFYSNFKVSSSNIKSNQKEYIKNSHLDLQLLTSIKNKQAENSLNIVPQNQHQNEYNDLECQFFDKKSQQVKKLPFDYIQIKNDFQQFNSKLGLKTKQQIKSNVNSDSSFFDILRSKQKQSKKGLFKGSLENTFLRQRMRQLKDQPSSQDQNQKQLKQSGFQKRQEKFQSSKIVKEKVEYIFPPGKQSQNISRKIEKVNTCKQEQIKKQNVKRRQYTPQQILQASMLPELSENGSCSFQIMKSNVTSNDIHNLKNFVNQSVKTVAVNLNKYSKQKKQPKIHQNALEFDKAKPQKAVSKNNQSNFINNNQLNKRISKLFGQNCINPKDNEINLSFFDQFQKDKSLFNQSRPSTVQKVDDRSNDSKSDFMKHFQDLKENGLATNLFGQNKLEQKLVKEQNNYLNQKQNQQNIVNISSENSPLNLQSKQIVMNIDDFSEASMSLDPISFSKLQSYQSSLRKDSEKKSENQSYEQFVKLDRKNEISNDNISKIKSINFELDSDSECQNEKIVSDQQLQFDQLSAYKSDSDEQQNKEERVSLFKPKQILAPVIQEQLQQSQFHKYPSACPLPSSLQKIDDSSSNKSSFKFKKCDIKQLQDEFLKDLSIQNKQSECQITKINQKIPIKRKTIYLFEKKKGISKNKGQIGTMSDFSKDQDVSLHSQPSNMNDIKQEKYMITQIKSDIERLSKKMQQNISLDELNSKQSESSLKSRNKRIKKIELSLNDIFSKESQLKQNSQNEKKNDKSLTFSKDNKIKQMNNTNILDEFDHLNKQQSKNIFQQFNKDLTNLRDKIQNDTFVFHFPHEDDESYVQEYKCNK